MISCYYSPNSGYLLFLIIYKIYDTILCTLEIFQCLSYKDSSPFLSASTGESIDAFFAGIAAATTESKTGNANAIKIVNQFQGKFINNHKGYDVTIDPNLLIEKVHLTPMTINKDSKWQKKVVKSVLAKYGLNKKVIIWDKKPVF